MGADWRDLDDLNSTAERIEREGYRPTGDSLIVCPKCGGRGSRTYGYVNIKTYACGTCKGSGRVSNKRLQNIERFKASQQTADRNRSDRMIAFTQQHADVVGWLHRRAEGFEFASSLLKQFQNTGSLTPNQLAAAQRCIAKDTERAGARAAVQEARSVVIDSSKIVAALNSAASTGLKGPCLRTGKIYFKLAKPTSRNPGCVYVTAGGDAYLGKIDPQGKFMPSRDCSEELKQAVVDVSSDPLGKAIEHGRMTGHCACCGRLLVDPVSVERGIGPICARRFFGA